MRSFAASPSARGIITLKSGVTTMWLADAGGGRPTPVARLPFRDRPR